MRVVIACIVGAGVAVGALAVATQTVAAIFDHQPLLDGAVFRSGDATLYRPWQVLVWDARWAETYPRPFALARLVACAGLALSACAAALALRAPPRLKPSAKHAWGDFRDAARAGLFATKGVVLGKLEGEILCYDGPEHHLLVGASRSGKGRGHVVPTLLAWPASALVLDLKGELADGDARVGFVGAAGFRETLGPVLRFAPTRLDSASFNPLLEVRRGPNEVRDVQNIVDVLVDPAGGGRAQDFWDRSAKQVLVGVILHVLYAEPAPRKTLAVVREKLRDLDAAAQLMKATLHRRNPVTGAPETHPEVLHAAESFLSGEERLKSGVKATAGWSIGLAGMEAASPSGAAGLSDRTDRHLDRLAGAVALSAVMSIVANRAEDDERSDRLARGVGDAAAQEAARVGARLVDRELEVRPTLRVRAGAPVRVLVLQDIALRPYRDGAP